MNPQSKTSIASARYAHLIGMMTLFTLLATLSRHGWADPAPQIPDPPAIVYRYDDRGPDIIFSQGFRSVGLNHNLINHALGVGMRRSEADCTEPNQDGSAFVSTTSHQAAVRRMARGRLQGVAGEAAERTVWIYTIRATVRFFGVQRSLQRAIDRMEDCEITGVLQARLNTLDAMINVARGEREWVAYRYIAPSLIHHATQYRLSANGQDIEEIPGTRQDNPAYVDSTSHGNTVAWLIDALARPRRSFMFRVYNQANAATMSALERARAATFGAQFCTPACLSPANASRAERSPNIPPDDTELDATVQKCLRKTCRTWLNPRSANY